MYIRFYFLARSKFDKLDQALLTDKREARRIRRLKSHPDFDALNKAFDTSGISSLFRQTLLAGLAGTSPEESLLKSTADFVSSKLPTTHEIDLLQPLHFLAGGYGVGKTSLAFRMALQINSFEPGRAIVVNYSSDQESSWTNAAIMGARLGVEVLPASSTEDLAELVRDSGSTKLLLVDISTYNESEYASSRSSAGFIDRLTAANNTIIDQFSTSTFAEIDGVVEHYYWNKCFRFYK